MKDIDTSAWTAVGETANTRYFEIGSDVLAGVPRPGAVDDQTSARENIAFQNEHWHKKGHGGVVVVFFDNMVSQDKDARRVYQADPDPSVMFGTALVGGTMLSRAMGSFFLGIARPRIPVRMCATLADALGWARELNEAHRRK